MKIDNDTLIPMLISLNIVTILIGLSASSDTFAISSVYLLLIQGAIYFGMKEIVK